jgi:hypothetical protein
MRILLLHPEDSPRRGPWSAQRWDLIVDLGRSSPSSVGAWQELAHSPVLRADSFRRGAEDLKQVRELFSLGMGRLLDEEGIDWWELTSLVVMPEAEAVLVFLRMIAEIGPGKNPAEKEIWATRPGWPGSVVADLLKCPLQSFSEHASARLNARVRHYRRFIQRFSAQQIKEIFFDKYDSGYDWRSRFASRTAPLSRPSILLPSAYGNVSHMAASYARLVPEQSFLLVATRRSGEKRSLPPNVQLRRLAAYAGGEAPVREGAAILEHWTKLRAELYAIPEFALLSRAGVLDRFPRWFQDGLRARNAWRRVIECEPVCGVLCGDDSNIFTRLPVMLAARRGISTADFHHGAMDGRYLLKTLPCDAYLAKNEMERDYLLRVCELPPGKVVLGAPAVAENSAADGGLSGRSCLVFFSEPYENAGMRAEEVYGELLPPLCRIAQQSGRSVIVKLHPFESVSQRTSLISSLLSEEDFERITIVDGPMSQSLLSNSWFGVTVESTTVLDCYLRGVPCFVCAWLTLSPFGYVQQYARFGIAQILRDAKELNEIPGMLDALRNSPSRQESYWNTAEPEMLRQLLGTKSQAGAMARRIS